MAELDKEYTSKDLSKLKELITDTMIELAHSYKLFNMAYNPQTSEDKKRTTTEKKLAYQMLANSVIKADAVIYFLSQLLKLDNADGDTVDKIVHKHFKQYGIKLGEEQNEREYQERKRNAS